MWKELIVNCADVSSATSALILLHKKSGPIKDAFTGRTVQYWRVLQ
jgi:hypothetical protein